MSGFFKKKKKQISLPMSMLTHDKLKDFNGHISNKFLHLWELVGNTPMIEIMYRFDGKIRTIYAKCEQYNLTGSIKDRMALYILQRSYVDGTIKPYSRIVEATCGNGGISFSAIGRALGHEVTILMPDWMNRAKRDIISSLGADTVLISKEEGGFLGCIERAQEMAEGNPDIFLPKRFADAYNAESHAKTTGREIQWQLEGINLKPDAFVAGVGTGGTVMGVNHYLKMKNPNIKVHPLEPQESPTLSTGFKNGSHRIEGISDEFIPSIVDLDLLDEVVRVSDGDAIAMAQKMGKELGLAVGISSGANIVGAMFVQDQLGDHSVVVTVLPDSNRNYLSTDLMKKEKIGKGYISARTELLEYTPVQRAFEVN